MWKKRISLITMIVIVICLITLSYFLNMERKQSQQYEAYLSQHIANEISGMYPRLKENEEILNKIISTNTITKDEIARMNFNYAGIIKNKIEMQQLATHLKVDFGKHVKQNYSFYDSVIGITEDFLKHIDSNKLKDSYLIVLSMMMILQE
ncbi:hypothetical protein [Oceanobacillus salinisoli]|uniref:hypothetical protein n=1 Tax=Oceanobacillus salinisoli TaxID=2678611 RepID=UPI0012E22925|nr:hypothetical protein [Oceanobacillus salinisoli]